MEMETVEINPKGMRNFGGMRLDKLLSLVAGILILIALITIVRTPLASGYELSIYDVFPFYFWFLFVGAIACGVGILLHQAFGREQSRWWVAGFLIIVIANSLFLLLPVFRGYAVYGRYDTLTHLGLIRDITATGDTGENWYPMVHLFGGSIGQVTGLSLESTLYVLFVLITGVYVMNLYLLAWALTNDHRASLAILALGAPLIYAYFHVNIHPMLFSFFMLMLVLYGYHRRADIAPHRNAIPYALLMLVGGFAVVYGHPVTSIFAMLALLGLGLGIYVFSRLGPAAWEGRLPLESAAGSAWRVSLILLAPYFVWYFTFSQMEMRIEKAYEWLTGEGQAGLAGSQLTAAEEAGVSFSDTLRIAFNAWGGIALLLLVSGVIAAAVLVRAFWWRRGGDRALFLYAVLFVVGVGASLAELIGGWGENADVIRVSRFAVLMGTILTGLALFKGVSRIEKGALLRPALIAGGVIMILVLTALSLGEVYASPRISRVNAQVTHIERTGFIWFEDHNDPRMAAIGRKDESVFRFQDYLFGVDSAPETLARWFRDEKIPSHFGYGSYDHFSEHVDFNRMRLRITGGDIDHRYVLLTRTDELYPLAKPESARSRLVAYTEPDFAALSRDPSIARLYSNGEFAVWLATRDEGGA